MAINGTPFSSALTNTAALTSANRTSAAQASAGPTSNATLQDDFNLSDLAGPSASADTSPASGMQDMMMLLLKQIMEMLMSLLGGDLSATNDSQAANADHTGADATSQGNAADTISDAAPAANANDASQADDPSATDDANAPDDPQVASAGNNAGSADESNAAQADQPDSTGNRSCGCGDRGAKAAESAAASDNAAQSQANPTDTTVNANDTSDAANSHADNATPAQTQEYQSGKQSGFWGDPHLEGFDGEKYDVMGEDGKTYNMLSDKNFHFNTTFSKQGQNGATVVSRAGFVIGDNKLAFDTSGDAPTFDGAAMAKDKAFSLIDNGKAQWDGKKLDIQSREFNVSLENEGQALRSKIDLAVNNPFEDGVKPQGLLGITADGVAGAHQGVNNANDPKNGGTVIDGTVSDYEVADLFATGSKSVQLSAEAP